MSTQPTKRRKVEGSLPMTSLANNHFDFADLENWTPDDICNYLTAEGFADEVPLFKEHEVSGKVLDQLTEELIDKIGVRAVGKRLELLQEFQKLKKLRDNAIAGVSVDPLHCKVFHDPIHGHIELHPLCVRIIDTPQFQRLRYIKQLGCAYLVFPGAAHNRFEHSVGVYSLAESFCRTLQDRQRELNITEKDVLCVLIAGLCHDLGHGPFSHVFDKLFIPTVEPDSEWNHEKASVDMFDHLIEANQLIDVFAKYGLDAQDINFIKELIKRGKKVQNNEPLRDTGRNKEKNFLYEIVANERNGIDVDKWDYFLRDCHNLGIFCSFDCHRFEKLCRVIEVEGEKQICARDKEVGNVYNMFETRYSLHRRAYQHRVAKIIEIMLVEALVKANEHFLVKGKEGKMLKMSEAIGDMVAYTNMTDDIILQIMRSDDKKLAESRRILEMVQRRELYKFIGKTQPTQAEIGNTVKKRDEIKKDIIQAQKPEDMDGEPLEADQLIIHAVYMHYGKGPENPIDYVRFYSKANPDQVLPRGQLLDSQMLIPKRFAEHHIRVYCKRRDDPEYIKKVSKCFQSWCDKNKHTVQKVDKALQNTDVEWSKNTGTPKKNRTENRQPGRPEKKN